MLYQLICTHDNEAGVENLDACPYKMSLERDLSSNIASIMVQR